MSSVEVNDENRGFCPGGKHSSLNNDIFALDQPTGRPSILRQTENLPSKTVPKGSKVCFQTPRRDPMTKRIVSPSKLMKMTSVDECTKAMEPVNLDTTWDLPQKDTEVSSYPDDDMPIQSKGGYQLDFDNLDDMNPFQCSNKMVLSPARPPVKSPPADQSVPQHTPPENNVEEQTNVESALDETLPFTASVENSLVDNSTNISSTESSVVTVVAIPTVEEQDSRTATPDIEPHTPTTSNAEGDKASGSFVEDAPLPAKGLYNLDFDNLDSVNSFQSGGPKIPNSPMPEKKLRDNNEPVEEPQIQEAKCADTVHVPDAVAQKLPVQPEAKPIAAVVPSTTTAKAPAAESQPDVAPVKEGPVKLEFNFDDGGEVKQRRPPKKFGKRPPGAKSKDANPAPAVETPIETLAKPDASDEVPVPKGSYSFDIDKFDDPNFNPFGTKVSMDNSPMCSKKPSPVRMEAAIPEQMEKEAVSPACDEPRLAAPDRDIGTVPSLPEFSGLCQPEQKSEAALFDFTDSFVPGTAFMGSDFDGQMDYLEQFGSSNFKESALRKQSLYLKFDPLLRESPKKSAAGPTHVPRPAAFSSRLEAPQMTEKEATHRPRDYDFKLIDAAAPTPVFKNLVPAFPQLANAEDSIIEVLKYSQKDMDAIVARVQAEGKENEERWCAKYKNLLDDGQEMRKRLAEYELLMAKMKDDQEKDKGVAQMRLDEALLEKEQVASDLNSMERSCSELFKRLQKYKDMIEGYKKNEENLKAGAQSCIARIQKEEQRYQTLKAHADEKIACANQEISAVQSRYKAEVSALQAQLRREQLKVQSLDQTLDQKEKEVEELTKLCDELITKVQGV
ncbi:transforming acidic coiled-coil-containing protein 3 [Solea solea]|uniref:transforming acidic coiled-coil-containing protein 3 n=1 Tax=Solea solea TaxID=90069 RepID=UPI002729D5E6|nr:transforming acidic coiled-coil-containing protein 3 [Solea solea]